MKALYTLILLLCSSALVMSQDYTITVSNTTTPQTSCFVCFPVFSTEQTQTYTSYKMYFGESPTVDEAGDWEELVSFWPQYPTDPEQNICGVMDQLSPGTTYYARLWVAEYSSYLDLVVDNPETRLFEVLVTAQYTTQDMSTSVNEENKPNIMFVNGQIVGDTSPVIRVVSVNGQTVDPKGTLPPGGVVKLADGTSIRIPVPVH